MMTAKSTYGLLLLAIVFIECSSSKKSAEEIEKIRMEVVDNDLAFSDFSQKNGFAKALAEYAAPDAIKLNPRQYSTFGKEQLQKEAAADSLGSSEGALTWKPMKVHVSDAGDMAAAFGDWYFTFKSPKTSNDTTLYGNYTTVWKKQADGTWKFILDSGNPVPGPTTEQMLQLIR